MTAKKIWIASGMLLASAVACSRGDGGASNPAAAGGQSGASSTADSGAGVAGSTAGGGGSGGTMTAPDAGVFGGAGGSGAAGCTSAVACDDAIPCTVDSCVWGTCSHAIGPNAGDTACRDEQYCTLVWGCVARPACATDGDCADAWRGDACKANPRCDPRTSVCLFDVLDKDRDGHFPPVCGGDDCDDSSAMSFPGAIEICDGKDNDCAGPVDDGAPCGDPLTSCQNGWCLCKRENLCGGACVDRTSDPANCAVCGARCAAGATCDSGVCQCPGVKLACGGACVDTNSDDANCGSCGVPCTNQTCVNGTCTTVCAAGRLDCNGEASDGCETYLNAAATCGKTCANTIACSGATPGCDSGVCTAAPPSCEGLPATCGPASNEFCCASPLVAGGTFYRDYDSIPFTGDGAPATVGTFRLDRFEVTVGRFRKFVTAWNGGWRPLLGDGKHTHLNGGSGLAATGGGFEPGWDSTWSDKLVTTQLEWDTKLLGSSVDQTWTTTAGGNETRPINNVTWYEAAAFCIWDGGFIPSEAEWIYAATGGSEQRQFPWPKLESAPWADCAFANYAFPLAPGERCALTGTNNVGSESPKGDGKYRQADLAGNVGEWSLDVRAAYQANCVDCANSTPGGGNRAIHGGSFRDNAGGITASGRFEFVPSFRHVGFGARCARRP